MLNLFRAKKEKRDKKDEAKRRIAQSAQRDMAPGLQRAKRPHQERDVLFTIKVVLVGDASTLEARRQLLWGYTHRHGEEAPPDVGTVPVDVVIDGFEGRVAVVLYDNTVDRATSYFPFSGVHGVFITYRHDDEESFRHLYNWLTEARRFSNKETVFACVLGCFMRQNDVNRIPKEHQAVIELMKLPTYNYCAGFELEFDNFMDEMLCCIRRTTFPDDVLETLFAKKLVESGEFRASKSWGFVPVQSIVDQNCRKQREEDPYRRLISVDVTHGFTYTLRVLFCGSEVTALNARRLAFGLVHGFETPVRTALMNLDNIATRYVEHDNVCMKLKLAGFDYSVGKNAQYSPFINTLGVVIVFDHTDTDSFRHVDLWVRQARREANLELAFLIVGINRFSSTFDQCTDRETHLEELAKDPQITHTSYDESKQSEFKAVFRGWVHAIRTNVFRRDYLLAVEREMKMRARLSATDAAEQAPAGPKSPFECGRADDQPELDW